MHLELHQLDDEQRKYAIQIVENYKRRFFGEPAEPSLIIADGPGGCGKTTSTAAAINAIRSFLREQRRLLLAKRLQEDQPVYRDPQAAMHLISSVPAEMRPNVRAAIHFEIRRRKADIHRSKKEQAQDRKDAELLEELQAVEFALVGGGNFNDF